jgi:hypothetical protein
MRRRLIAAAVLVAAGIAGIVPALADVAQPRVVSTNPADWTPHALDGTVRAVAVVGTTTVVGGTFTAISDTAERSRYRQHYLFAFDSRTGALRTGFAPRLDGAVYALAAGPGNTVYVGGAFRTVNGVEQRGLAKLSLANGARVAGFTARINWGDVRTLAARGNRLYAGGTFSAVNGVNRVALARLDGRNGALDAAFDARLSAQNVARARVEDMALSPDGHRLVVIGAITHVAGHARAQIVMLNVAGARSSLYGWYTEAYRPQCDPTFDTYLRGVDFAPNGKYFVVVGTGTNSSPSLLCDTAARFETLDTGRRGPTWVNHTGGNTLFSVAVTGSAVYVGGHQQWLNNPHGKKSAGPGAVARPGIGAINPKTGKALAWNPTRARGVGVRALVATPQGLYVGSDTDALGNEYHGRIGFFPL